MFTANYKGKRLTGPTEEAVRALIAELEAVEGHRARWPAEAREAMAALGALFPTLRNAPGLAPWEPEQLIGWLNGPAPGSGAQWAGRFVLSVWNSETDWSALGLAGPGRFDLFRAMASWDEGHVAAMSAWIDAPFWP